MTGIRLLHEIQMVFVNGLCRMLNAMNAATSRCAISAIMAHLLVCNSGSRFMFSHGFGTLLVGQLEATLEGWLTDVRIRTSKYKGDKIVRHDSTSDDYIKHRRGIFLPAARAPSNIHSTRPLTNNHTILAQVTLMRCNKVTRN